MKALPHQYVDHRSHNPLDNRKVQLRICTNSQNNMYRYRQSNNTSGYKGVSWNQNAGKWRGYIKLNQKQIHLGLFACPLEAALAYNDAATKYFGEYALLNEIAK